jgi:hypothetical protein
MSRLRVRRLQGCSRSFRQTPSAKREVANDGAGDATQMLDTIVIGRRPQRLPLPRQRLGNVEDQPVVGYVAHDSDHAPSRTKTEHTRHQTF